MRGWCGKSCRRIIPAYAGSTCGSRCRRDLRRDHPRIRGEHRADRLDGDGPRGSSPHTRGARGQQKALAGNQRIIPAYAGSTGRPLRRHGATRDHPRIRGEHDIPFQIHPNQHGSSPHTRGAREFGLRVPGIDGIIPAYAGSTYSVNRRDMRRKDHPRIRGEHSLPRVLTPSSPGSSPHTRGAPRHRQRVRFRGGIIPAYAGSTSRPDARECRYPDHPRIRGEHSRLGIFCAMRMGSSPHTRGARGDDRLRDAADRIIPAYAGSTRPTTTSGSTTMDHPRIRGEHGAGLSNRRRSEGSSPHTRGARGHHVVDVVRARIIPAYAGSTYSHECELPDSHGSSPHTRGAPTRATRAPDPSGIIPAYAGSTRSA